MSLDVSTLTTREVFNIAIRLEEDGIEFYRKASEKAHSQHLREVLNRLADHEVEHRTIFRKMAQDIPVESAGSADSEKISPRNMAALVEAGVFPSPEERHSAIGSLHSPAQALRFGIKVEQGSIVFYESAARALQAGELRRTFNRILAEERQHVRLLNAELKVLKAC